MNIIFFEFWFTRYAVVSTSSIKTDFTVNAALGKTKVVEIPFASCIRYNVSGSTRNEFSTDHVLADARSTSFFGSMISSSSPNNILNKSL